MTADSLHADIATRFSAAASTYGRHARVQAAAADHLCTLLPPVLGLGSLLEIGCGTGHLTRLLKTRYPNHALHVVDTAAAMISICRRSLPNQAGIQFHVMDAAAFEPDAPLRLVASNCALHWVEPLETVARRLRGHLRSDGHLVASLMIEPTLGELRSVRESVAPHKPPRARMRSESEVLGAVQAAGFRLVHVQRHRYVEKYASAADFLQALHELGVTGGAVSRSHHPLNRAELTALKREYQARHGDAEGRVCATYEVLFLSARP